MLTGASLIAMQHLFLVDRPSAKLALTHIHHASETDMCFLREANQREAEKDRCNDEKQSGAIGVR